MTKPTLLATVEEWLFRHRLGFLVLFLVLTAVLFGFATQTKVDARFEKQLPQQHEYIETFRKYQDEFGGANRVIVALVVKEGDVFTTDYFNKLEALTDEVYAMLIKSNRWSVANQHSPESDVNVVPLYKNFFFNPSLNTNSKWSPSSI